MIKINFNKIFISMYLISASVFAQHGKLSYNDLIRTGNSEFYFTPIGLCEDYPEETTTKEIIVRDFELMKKLNINLLRISFGWDAIEAVKDSYDWGFWDYYVKTANEEYNITLIPYVCYNPQWNAGEDTLRFWNHPPNDYDEFYQFMFDLVSRYKNYIKSWELWNEPNLPTYWQGSEAEFAKLVRTGAKAVKDADPQAIVVLGGMAASRPNFFHNLFRYHNVSEYVDAVNLHNYYETWQFYPVEKIVDLINEYVYTIDLFGDDQALWIAEFGYSTFRNGRKVSDAYYASYDYEHTPQYQAVDLIKRISLILSTGNADAIAWYEIKDLPLEEEVIGDEYNNRHLGIAYPDHTLKPAATALSFIKSLFDAKHKIYSDITVDKKLNSVVNVNSFQLENGDIIIITWLQTNLMGKDNHHLRNKELVKDLRLEKFSISLQGNFNNLKTFNELGEKIEKPELEFDGKKTIIKDLNLRGGEIKVITLESSN